MVTSSDFGTRAECPCLCCIETPKNPVILAHGLLGFEELNIIPRQLGGGIHYWRGITEALQAKGIEVITATVPASGSVEARAKKLGEDIERKAKGKSVNIIAHSMVIILSSLSD